jgi:hypothetical protein
MIAGLAIVNHAAIATRNARIFVTSLFRPFRRTRGAIADRLRTMHAMEAGAC